MSKQQISLDEELDEPLQDVLGRVSAELLDVAVLIERLEPLLSNGRSNAFLESPEHMRIMQGIDLAVQKARGLAEFLDGIGERVDTGHLIDISTALNLITLAEMKHRLRVGDRAQPSAEVYQKASGDLDFF